MRFDLSRPGNALAPVWQRNVWNLWVTQHAMLAILPHGVVVRNLAVLETSRLACGQEAEGVNGRHS